MASTVGISIVACMLANVGATAAGTPPARIGDSVSARAGGPGTIFPPGAPTVLICGRPAARVGDASSTAGTIATGSATVLIAGRPAARVGDATFGGGIVVAPGCPTVLIGE